MYSYAAINPKVFGKSLKKPWEAYNAKQYTVCYKLFVVEKFRGFRRSIGKHKTFMVKHFHLVLRMAGKVSFKNGRSSSRVFFKRILVIFRLGEGLWNNATFPGRTINTQFQCAW